MPLVLAGATSGSTTIQATDAVTQTITLPNATGTIALTAAPTFTGQATIPTINLTGGQITFPATAVPSADANTLDDYEEGTWTPTITFNGLGVGVTYTTQVGKYTKIGNLVNASCYIYLSSKGSSTGGVSVNNLPFTTNTTSNYFQAAAVWAQSLTSTVGGYTAYAGPNSVYANIEYTGTGTSASLINTNVNNSSQFMLNITYAI
jgi:hypothetical protein